MAKEATSRDTFTKISSSHEVVCSELLSLAHRKQELHNNSVTEAKSKMIRVKAKAWTR
jgi:hypothetical protein